MPKNVYLTFNWLFGWVWNSGLEILILQLYLSDTPIFSCWTSGTCPLIFLSSSLFITSSLALLSGGFGELYHEIILLNFSFFFKKNHILISKSSFIYSEFLFWSDCSHFTVAIYSFITLRFLQHFYLSCFISSLHAFCFLQIAFFFFVCLLLFTWEALLTSVTRSNNFLQPSPKNSSPPTKKYASTFLWRGRHGLWRSDCLIDRLPPALPYVVTSSKAFHAVNSCVWRESWMEIWLTLSFFSAALAFTFLGVSKSFHMHQFSF